MLCLRASVVSRVSVTNVWLADGDLLTFCGIVFFLGGVHFGF